MKRTSRIILVIEILIYFVVALAVALLIIL